MQLCHSRKKCWHQRCCFKHCECFLNLFPTSHRARSWTTNLAPGRKWGLAEDRELNPIKSQRSGVSSQAQPRTHHRGSAGSKPPGPPSLEVMLLDLKSLVGRPGAAWGGRQGRLPPTGALPCTWQVQPSKTTWKSLPLEPTRRLRPHRLGPSLYKVTCE